MNIFFKQLTLLIVLTLGACEKPESDEAGQSQVLTTEQSAVTSTHAVTDDADDKRAVVYTEERAPCMDYQPLRKPLFGDLHVHTAFSFDAAANTTGTLPEDAHRFAVGEPIPFFPVNDEGEPMETVQIDRPLDFLAVTDHGEFLGERVLCRDRASPKYDSQFCQDYRTSERHGAMMLATIITQDQPVRVPELCGNDGKLCRNFAVTPWQKIIEAAEAAYDRSEECTFTSFIGYEYTGTPANSNYHRNVIFRNNQVPSLPISAVEAPRDFLLWETLNGVCEDGCDYVTIPHNSNLSNGRLLTPYLNIDQSLESRREYAELRLSREPVVEIFQHKGNSECVNGLASVIAEPDELCNFERVRIFGDLNANMRLVLVKGRLVRKDFPAITNECKDGIGEGGMRGAGCISKNDFVRTALVTGLEEEKAVGVNPIKVGIIASTDTHTSTPGAVSERQWGGHVSKEATPEERLQPGLLPSNIQGNPGGLAGVWAMENSRDAIFEALKRREVFGTSGPRIVPRFFGGWEYDGKLCESIDMVEHAYQTGVAMGGDLSSPAGSAAPVFLASALKDPAQSATALQMLQIVKGWVDSAGGAHTEVFTIAGSPDNDATVVLETGESIGVGHDSLCTVFRDPSFDPARSAYYYLRVVENPSARWSMHDCLRIAAEQRPAVCSDPSVPKVIQEMAWTSPIWYRPEG